MSVYSVRRRLFLPEISARFRMKSAMASGRRFTRQFGAMLLNLLIAIIIAAFAQLPVLFALSIVIRSKTLNAILVRESLSSLLIAALLGFLVYAIWKSDTAKWVWTIGVLIFAVRAISLAGSPHGIWFQMSGEACTVGTRMVGCMNYFIFTTAALRAVGYSIGAWGSWRLGSSGAAFVADSVFARFRNPFLASDSEDSATDSLNTPS